ncbi:MAG TPA: hypothetical protein DCL60_01050, partial [Armatimonadetes bacterium]|nr:hypothetical protein [Armatimonadota bacterium]
PVPMVDCNSKHGCGLFNKFTVRSAVLQMQRIQEAYAMYRIGKEELAEIEKVIDGRVLFRVNNQEKEVERFEKEWADVIGAKYALCVTGGTNA